jgi:hypothetical protein
MVDPNEVRKHLRKHFSEVTPEEFIENVSKYCPEILQAPPAKTEEDVSGVHLQLFQPQPAPLPLNAYFACALTGLASDQYKQMVELSEIIDEICQTDGIDLYQPRLHTDPVKHAKLPAESVFKIDKARVLGSDLLVHLCDYPSTGAGEELAMALDALLPILLISHSQTHLSRMVKGIPGYKVEIEYTDHDSLRSELKNALLQIRPVLEERKLAFSKYRGNVVGNTIRLMREEAGLTRKMVASSSPSVLEVERLRQIEESADQESNPSLIELRVIATILKTTVADLVEPDMDERLLNALQDWPFRSRTAQFGRLNIKNRNKILRRLLLRLIDSLEADE